MTTLSQENVGPYELLLQDETELLPDLQIEGIMEVLKFHFFNLLPESMRGTDDSAWERYCDFIAQDQISEVTDEDLAQLILEDLKKVD